MQNIENILFDLGGVLYEIAPARTRRAFVELGEKYGVSPDAAKLFAVFDGMERGEYEEGEFYEALRRETGMPASDEEIRQAWNAILVGPYAYAQRLTALAARGHRIALLSNTNRIHHEHFKSQTEKVFEPMERLFFSYELGCRKPDAQAFMHVAEKAGFRPENTLFVEDTPANVESARRLGFRVYAVGDPWRMNAELSAWLETGTTWEKI